MNNQTRIKTLFVAAALALPGLSLALTDQEAIDVCTATLVAKLEAAQGAPIKHRVGEDSSTSQRMVRDTTLFSLYAIDPRTDETVVRADCFITRSGRIQRLTTVPLYAANTD